jgi:uncharacterized membrane protein
MPINTSVNTIALLYVLMIEKPFIEVSKINSKMFNFIGLDL